MSHLGGHIFRAFDKKGCGNYTSKTCVGKYLLQRATKGSLGYLHSHASFLELKEARKILPMDPFPRLLAKEINPRELFLQITKKSS